MWSASWGGLRWVDMLAGDVLTLTDDGVDRRHVGSVAAAVRPRRDGGAVYGVERGFALEDPEGRLTMLPDLWDDTSIRMNEGGCDPDGRFYCGSMAYDKTAGAASLYRFAADRSSVERVLADVTISNGLDWSPDGSRAYYNDTDTHCVDVFDYDFEHGLTARRPLVRIDDDGRPDGLTVDDEGNVWTALNGWGQVRCYDTSGTLQQVIEVPTPQVTACAFGGDGLDRLFVTTSREGMSEDDDPLAGSVFVAQPGVRGRPVRGYAG